MFALLFSYRSTWFVFKIVFTIVCRTFINNEICDWNVTFLLRTNPFLKSSFASTSLPIAFNWSQGMRIGALSLTDFEQQHSIGVYKCQRATVSLSFKMRLQLINYPLNLVSFWVITVAYSSHVLSSDHYEYWSFSILSWNWILQDSHWRE